MTEEEVKKLIAENEFFVIKALKLLYSQQTEDEKEFSETNKRNGKGFNATDAAFCSSLIEQVNKFGQLTYKQTEALRKILPKYAKQISNLL